MNLPSCDQIIAEVKEMWGPGVENRGPCSLNFICLHTSLWGGLEAPRPSKKTTSDTGDLYYKLMNIIKKTVFACIRHEIVSS